MDINVEKFVRDYGRMCDTYYPNGCYDCPIDRNEKAHDRCNHIENLETIAPIVQKWAEEHPVKTYRMDFKEKFPNVADDFFEDNCVAKIYAGDICFDYKERCEACWDREMI